MCVVQGGDWTLAKCVRILSREVPHQCSQHGARKRISGVRHTLLLGSRCASSQGADRPGSHVRRSKTWGPEPIVVTHCRKKYDPGTVRLRAQHGSLHSVLNAACYACRQAADGGAAGAGAAGRRDRHAGGQGGDVRRGLRAIQPRLRLGGAARGQQLQRAPTARPVRGRLWAAPLAGRLAGVRGLSGRQAGAANILLDSAGGVGVGPWLRSGQPKHPAAVHMLKTE